uniref:RBR-type E3 ubiquitin transferase n=1 Tax=Kalanchoe fedtschenkoi TaxID=63787 RepID=A0A7N0ZTK2_KALFE
MAAKVDVIDLEGEAIAPSFTASGRTRTDSIPVEQYDEQRSLQRAILASLLKNNSSGSGSAPPPSIIDLTEHVSNDDGDGDDVELVFVKFNQSNSQRRPRKRRSMAEIGPSSAAQPPFTCEICFDPKPLTESFSVGGCGHVYCKECMSGYVAAKLQDSVVTQIGCPHTACRRGILEPHYCREILPPEVFERWGNVLCESVIASSEKFYCPFNDCSALLINDDGNGGTSAAITQSECPHCNRLFCAQCKTAWHLGLECSEFKKLNDDEKGVEDIMLLNLAKDNKWKRCPKCKMFVEKSQGCMYMRCRCGFAFCYNCGAASVGTAHICSKCGH